MSFSDAIGQIDQIVQWEQQLANPAAATQSASSGGTAATSDPSSTSASDGAGSSSFSNALAQAQAQDGTGTASLLDPSSPGTTGDSTSGTSGLLSGGDSQLLAALSSASNSGSSPSSGSANSVLSALESQLQNGSTTSASPLTGVTGASYTTATSPSDPRISSMVQEADSLVGKPYVWGGGHNNFGPQPGYDCSGFVSAVLHAGGYLSSPQDTTTLPSQPGIAQGPGQYVTIYDRDQPGQEGHVIIQIDGQFYESGGEQGSWGGGGGVEKVSTPSASYLATFNQVLHPSGL
jgi:cell wall-associated NlpC family hydrolase